MFVLARVADEIYAFSVEHVHEVSELAEITPVPGAPPDVVGIENLRGEVITVIDLARRLGLPTQARPRRVLIVAHEGNRVGLAVDAVLEVRELPDPVEAESDHLTGTVLIDGALIGVVDLMRLLERDP